MRRLTQFAVLIFAAATGMEAQPAPQQQATHKPQHHTRKVLPAAVQQPVPPPAPVVPVPVPVLEQPPTPATVQVDAGKLSVKAENSSLTAILHDISMKTGMNIDGLSKDQRIFGTYGPAAPREVLSALLDGVGYNVMMIGALTNGAPRQLVLTPRTTGPSIGGGGNRAMPGARTNNNNNDDEDDAQDAQDPNLIQAQQDQNQNQNQNQDQQQPPPTTPPGQNNARTPQQMLQEIQQMRQQQLQQQQSQQ